MSLVSATSSANSPIGGKEESKAVDEKRFLSVAQQLYDNGLGRILELIDTKGLWRVHLHDTGIVLDVKSAKGTRPQPGTFVVHIPEKQMAPRFGSFNQLTPVQAKIVAAMQKDICRLVTAQSVADLATGSPTKGSQQTRQTVAELEQRFGRLPRSPVCDAIEERKIEDRTLLKKREAREKALASISPGIFDEYLAKEKQSMLCKKA